MELNFEMLEPDKKTEFEPLPAGWYSAIVFATEKVISKTSGYNMLKVTYEITQPDYAGRRAWVNLNLYYETKPDVIEIAHKQLSQLSFALGLANIPKESDEMVNLHLDILLKIEEGSGGYGPQNKVTGYRSAPSPKPPVANTAPLPKAANGDLDGPDWLSS
tara:strand:- start:190 stop:672 length:483 start_codon:yes stop_codon:yes gene_type:complete